MRIATFDPGYKNFAFCVEDFDEEKLEKLKGYNPELKNRYHVDGTLKLGLKKILERVCRNGKIVLHQRVNLIQGKRDKENDIEIFTSMYKVLNEYIHIWDDCSIILIEQQMMFGRATNPMAVRLAQHIYSYFVGRYMTPEGILEKRIIYFPAFHKTQIFGAPKTWNPGKITKKGKQGKGRWKTLGDKQRKTWAVETALEFLQVREDEDTSHITLTRKKDDLCDTWLMLQAGKYMLYVDEGCVIERL